MKILDKFQRFINEKDAGFKYLTIVLVTIYVLYRFIYCLGCREPWYDEVYYISPALDYLLNGTLHIVPDFPRTPENAICWNTPMFSYVYSQIFDFFGFSFTSVRVIGLFSGLFIFFSFLFLIFKMTKNWVAPFVYVIFFITDKTIDPALFTGRPDALSFVFYICSLYLFNKTTNQNLLWKKYINIVVSGILLAIAMTISIRLVVECILFVLLPFLYINNNGHRKFLDVVLYGFFAVIGIFLIYYCVLGDVSLILNSAERTSETGLVSKHFGFDPYMNLLRTPYNAFKFVFFYFVLLFLIIIKKTFIKRNAFLLSNVLFVIGFTIFIKEVGQGSSNPYSMVLLPIVYVVFAYVCYILLNAKSWCFTTYVIVLFFILLTNLATFVPRFSFLILNPKLICYENKIEQFIEPYLSKDDIVLGAPRFYFMTRNKVSEFYITPLLGGSQFHLTNMSKLLKEKKCNIYIGEEPDQDSSKILNVELLKEIPRIEYNGFKWVINRYSEKQFGIYKIVYEKK